MIDRLFPAGTLTGLLTGLLGPATVSSESPDVFSDGKWAFEAFL